jgi:hypothetical protein
LPGSKVTLAARYYSPKIVLDAGFEGEAMRFRNLGMKSGSKPFQKSEKAIHHQAEPEVHKQTPVEMIGSMPGSRWHKWFQAKIHCIADQDRQQAMQNPCTSCELWLRVLRGHC